VIFASFGSVGKEIFLIAPFVFLQPNGANLTGGGTGSNFDPSKSKPEASYIPFNGAAPPSILPAGAWPALLLGCIGALFGTFGVFSRL
jgi:hypothetical protein